MRPKQLRRGHLMSLTALSLVFASDNAEAQTWPTKPLKAIIPIAAGSITDIVPRIVFEQLSVQLGQPIVVENRPGAALTIGTAAVAKADPDGYTLLVNSSAHAIAPALHPNLSYDPGRDFAAVIPLGVVPSVLVVPPARGFKSVAEFVAAAKAKPDAMNFASAGVGTGTHLGSIRFQIERRHARRARAVQERTRGTHRGYCRTSRFLPGAGRGRAASHQGRQAHGARGQHAPNARPPSPMFRPSRKPVSPTLSTRSGSASFSGKDTARHRREAES